MVTVGIAKGVQERFPDLHLAWVEVTDVTVGDPDAAVNVLAKAADHVRDTRGLESLKKDPLVRAYRDFYWGLGIDPTRTRPASEALNRRVLQGKDLPRINAFVDAYNAASLSSGVPLGAYDAARLTGNVILREAEARESFLPIGRDEPLVLEGGELVLADAARIVNFYPYRDADATKVTSATTRGLIVACGAPGVGAGVLEAAARLAGGHVAATCGGHAGEARTTTAP